MATELLKVNRTAYRSPNFWTRQYVLEQFGHQRVERFIVIHDTEGLWPGDAAYLCKPSTEASAHFVIAPDGTVYCLVNSFDVAWHAGVATNEEADYPAIRAVWGHGNENFDSIGIEISCLRGAQPTAAQMISLRRLVRELMAEYPHIQKDRLHIVGHYELKATKVDPKQLDLNAFVASL